MQYVCVFVCVCVWMLMIDLYDAIERGDIPQAFDLIQKQFPGLIEGGIFSEDYDGSTTNNNMTGIDTDDQDSEETARTSRVLFKLRCQQFIEIVRSATEVEAIRYAQQYLRPMHKEYHPMITEVASLIAYADPEQSNQAHLLSQDRRRQLADEVNCIVLGKKLYYYMRASVWLLTNPSLPPFFII